MWFWNLPAAAGELLEPVDDLDWELSWAELGFVPAGPEAPAIGPEHLALGPDGRWALWDPVRRRVHGAELGIHRVDDLAFAPDGDLLVLDSSSRILSRWEEGRLVRAVSLDRLVPSQLRLVVDGELAAGVDVFGNLRPIADLAGGGLDRPELPRLLPAPHRVELLAGAVLVDGRPIGVGEALAARVVGDWVLVEQGERGAVVDRVVVSLRSGRQVEIGPRSGPYRPAFDVAAGADGSFGWIEPTAAGLRLHRVAP